MAKLGRATDKDYIEAWQQYIANFRDSTPVDTAESKVQQLRRMEQLEKD